jgi:vacuolar protein sorting-associated protein 35
MSSLEDENHEAIRTKCALASSRLLKKPDQCRCVATCAHLFWSAKIASDDAYGAECHDSKRVMECLKKSGRIANQCMDGNVQAQLLVELLNVYILFHEKNNNEISASFLKQLVDKIKTAIDGLEKDSEETSQIAKHFENSLNHLRHLKDSKET